MKGFLLILRCLVSLNLSKWIRLYQESAKAVMITRLTLIVFFLLSTLLLEGSITPEAVENLGASIERADAITRDVMD